jgi:hypothetical protein
MRIVIANLPDDITEEQLRASLQGFAPPEKVSLQKQSDTPSAVIEMDITRAQAEALAKRISSHNFGGRTLTAWVPTMGWES